jgi:hypothetical protein
MLKKKVIKVAPALDKNGRRETYTHPKNGKLMHKTLVAFEDKSWGTYDHEEETQSYFKVGEEAEYKEVKTEYGVKLYRASTKGGGYSGHPKGWVPRSPGEVKRENLGYILQDVTKLVVADKLQLDEMVNKFVELSEAFFRQVDSVNDD